MTYLWDTNIMLGYIRASKQYFDLEKKYNFSGTSNILYSSVVSSGEILSLSMKLNWGKKKIDRMESFLEKVPAIPISRRVIFDSYAQIDAYSQSKHPTLPLPKVMTARNMGKNDIWIAATAHAIGATLVTTDKDFDHLDGIFLNVISG